LLPTPAPGEISFIPLPAISTDPNAGPTYGILPVVLFLDPQDQVKSIVAPSVTYNSLLGVNGTFRYFNYPNALERFEFEAGYTETIERKFDLHYRNLGLFGGRFHGDAEVLFDRDATVLFFGLGPESKPIDETNMTLQVAGLYATFGLNITPTTRLSLGETVERFEVLRGAIPNVPFTANRFPDLPGVNGATVHSQRAMLIYDDRDSQITPTRGLKASVFAEASAKLLGSGSDYIKAGAEAVYLRPFFGDRVILVGRGLFEATSTTPETPFEVLPTLGGETTLRGFSDNRFYGDARLLVNFEARVRVFKLRLFGFTSEFEVAPFVDAGQVFNNVNQLVQNGLEVTPGIGFRGIAPPSVVGHVDLGVSREGPAIYVGLDYPF
jgi:outer membrane protein assembly factor BamA